MLKAEKIERIITGKQHVVVQNNALCFLPGDRTQEQTAGHGFKSLIQDRLKQYSRLYQILIALFTPVLANPPWQKRCRELVNQYNDAKIIINIGSGPSNYLNRKDIINISLRL